MYFTGYFTFNTLVHFRVGGLIIVECIRLGGDTTTRAHVLRIHLCANIYLAFHVQSNL